MNAKQNDTCHRAYWPLRALTHGVLRVAIALLPLLAAQAPAAGNAAAGKQVYDRRCLGCHGDGSSANTLGPSLVGIIGRKAGTGDRGVHSRGLIEFGITWDEASLRTFLAAPTKMVPGTNMNVGGLNPQELDDVIAYLRTLH